MYNKRFKSILPLMILFLMLALTKVNAQEFEIPQPQYFEVGDALYSTGFPAFGHAAIYIGWLQHFNRHLIIETKFGTGIRCISWPEFLKGRDFWGAYKYPGMSMKQRYIIITEAHKQLALGVKYCFLKSGYKDPGKSFRCDGLVEYCYEVAGLDIVPYDEGPKESPLPFLSPLKQMLRLINESPQFDSLEVNLRPNETVSGIYPVIITAHDRYSGSGIRRMLIGLSKPGGAEVLYRNDSWYDLHRYIYEWNTAVFPDGDYSLLVIGYDKAGNTQSELIDVTIENFEPPDIEITFPESGSRITSINPTIEARVTTYFGKTIDITATQMRLDGEILSINYQLIEQGLTDDAKPYKLYRVYSNPYLDFNKQYELSLKAVDTAGQSNFVSWNFKVAYLLRLNFSAAGVNLSTAVYINGTNIGVIMPTLTAGYFPESLMFTSDLLYEGGNYLSVYPAPSPLGDAWDDIQITDIQLKVLDTADSLILDSNIYHLGDTTVAWIISAEEYEQETGIKIWHDPNPASFWAPLYGVGLYESFSFD